MKAILIPNAPLCDLCERALHFDERIMRVRGKPFALVSCHTRDCPERGRRYRFALEVVELEGPPLIRMQLV